MVGACRSSVRAESYAQFGAAGLFFPRFVGSVYFAGLMKRGSPPASLNVTFHVPIPPDQIAASLTRAMNACDGFAVESAGPNHLVFRQGHHRLQGDGPDQLFGPERILRSTRVEWTARPYQPTAVSARIEGGPLPPIPIITARLEPLLRQALARTSEQLRSALSSG